MVVLSGIAVMLNAQGKPGDAKSTFCVGLIIGAVGLANIVYDVDEWSVKKKIGIHYLLMLVSVYPVLLASGWLPLRGPLDFVLAWCWFTLCGVGILALIGLAYLVWSRRAH